MSARASSLDLRMVQQFLAVAEHLSFRKAAEQMHMAQPPLSQAIMRLESLLQTQLFDRSPRGVLLTPAGEVFRIEAVRLLNIADSAIARTQQAARGEWGDVHVAFIGPAMYALLSTVMMTFQQRFPGVKVHLHEGSSIEVARLLDADSVDVGFLVTPTSFDTDIDIEEIVADSLTAVLPAGHRLRDRDTVRLEELADDPFVLFSAKGVPTLNSRVLGLCQHAGFQPRIVQEAVQIPTVLSLVAQGLGVSVLPASVQALAPTGVIYRPLDADPRLLRVTISAAYRAGHLGAASNAFLEVARSYRRTEV